MKYVKNPYTLFFGFVLFVALLVRIYLLIVSPPFTWDGAVYIGMGKWFFSNGTIGLFEVFRPILFALVEGIFWVIGIDPFIGGGIIAIAASLGLMVLVYKIGEHISQFAGIFAAVVLGFTPIFMVYGNLPMSDILSTFLVVLGVYLSVKKKYFVAGLLVGLGFLTRFSQGLGAVVLAATLISLHYQEFKFTNLLLFVRRGMLLFGGFALVVVPYVLWSAHWFGDPLIPLREGNAIIGHSAHLYQKGPWFYIREVSKNNTLYLFVVVGLWGALGRMVRKTKMSPYLLMSVIGFVIYFAYFTYQPHKELRYAIPILPFAAVLAGYGLSLLATYLKTARWALFLCSIVIMIGLTISYLSFVDPTVSKARTEYYSYFNNVPASTTLIATEPMSVTRGDTLLLTGLYDNWGSAFKLYKEYKNKTQYVSLDSCVLESSCSVDTTCRDGQAELFADLDTNAERVFYGEEGRCTLRIYRMNK